MASLNFVPDDYIQNNESHRVNTLCVVLVLVVIGSLSGVFGLIKIKQRASVAEEAKVFSKMNQMQQSLVQFEQLQVQRERMMVSALTIADLLESVPRSTMLAQLTNALPMGASLTSVGIIQKDSNGRASASQKTSHYQAAKGKSLPGQSAAESPEKRLVTEVTITGLAPSDLQVASYIKRLDDSLLMDEVVLVESKEHDVEHEVFRQFELNAKLAKDVKLSPEVLDSIRGHANNSINRF